MSALSGVVIRQFCDYCDWAHQCWLLRKHLYDENPRLDLFQHPHHKHFFVRLERILQSYWLHEIAKLHDPAAQGGQINLTVDYILSYGAWTPSVEVKLRELRDRLAVLSQAIRGARNKLLSHNDLAAILHGGSLGTFEAGADIAYFEALKAFASLVHNEVIGGPFLFDDLTGNDAHAFMSAFSKGVA